MAATSDAVAIRELEGRLHRPERGENAYREGAEARTRIEALSRLREFAEAGKIRREGRAGGINTHVHTSKSFSFFDSPSHAVWHAYLAQVSVFGINDHATLAGHEEFGKACKAAGIRPAFSLEAVALWDEALKAGHAVNDPANPGRAYLTAKGVTGTFPPGSRGAEDLRRMNSALLERHSEMTARLASHLEKKLKTEGAVTWEGVLALTPHGAPTERHVALSAALFFERKYPKVEERARAVGKVTGSEPSPDELASPSAFQELLRAKLLQPGRPAHVKESKEAFLPLDRIVSLALDLGGIPTYPVLGDPVTPWEEDLDELFDRLEAQRIHAVDVIPDRNGRERLSEIVSRAAARGLPIFNGTEHNTKSPAPLVDRFFFDDEFRPHFERGARVLLGHQALRAAGKTGYVDGEGRLPPGDRESNLARVEEAGKRR